jgi:hypothetical protein
MTIHLRMYAENTPEAQGIVPQCIFNRGFINYVILLLFHFPIYRTVPTARSIKILFAKKFS